MEANLEEQMLSDCTLSSVKMRLCRDIGALRDIFKHKIDNVVKVLCEFLCSKRSIDVFICICDRNEVNMHYPKANKLLCLPGPAREEQSMYDALIKIALFRGTGREVRKRFVRLEAKLESQKVSKYIDRIERQLGFNCCSEENVKKVVLVADERIKKRISLRMRRRKILVWTLNDLRYRLTELLFNQF